MSSSVFRFNPDSNGFQTEKSVPYFSVSAETLFKHPGIKTEKNLITNHKLQITQKKQILPQRVIPQK